MEALRRHGLLPFLENIASPVCVVEVHQGTFPQSRWTNKFCVQDPITCLCLDDQQLVLHHLIELKESESKSINVLLRSTHNVSITFLEHGFYVLIFPGEYEERVSGNYSTTLPSAKLRDTTPEYHSHHDSGLLPSSLEDFLRDLESSATGRLIKGFDWKQKTSLGAISEWPQALCLLVSISIHCPFAMCIYWGKDKVMLYNDKFAEVIPPLFLGISLFEVFSWDEQLGRFIQSVMKDMPIQSIDQMVPIGRGVGPDSNFTLEDTFQTWAHVPVILNGNLSASISLSSETTESILALRRGKMINEFWEKTASSSNVAKFCEAASLAFQENTEEVPFMALYTVQQVQHTTVSTALSENYTISLARRCLEGKISKDHPLTPEHLELMIEAVSEEEFPDRVIDLRGKRDFTLPFAKVSKLNEPFTLLNIPISGENGQEELNSALIVPLMFGTNSNATGPDAVVILGLNKARKMNSQYTLFLRTIWSHISLGLSTALGHEMESKRKSELLALDEAKNSFFANTSHELRTPLTLILGPLRDVIDYAVLDEASKRTLQVVWKHANRLQSMVDKLLDFSTIEAGRMPMKFRPADIGAITNTLCELFRDAITHNKVEYVISSPQDSPEYLPVYIVPELYEKIVYNLVENAFKYCQQGTITVKLESTPSEALFSVSDTGVGIPTKDIPKIFDKFNRSDSNSRTTTGFGIGLALTLEVVHLLGGEITVESILGQGTTFKVHLKRGNFHLVDREVFEEAVPNAPSFCQNQPWIVDEMALDDQSTVFVDDTQSPDFFHLKDQCVVVVDDSHDVRVYLVDILKTKFSNVKSFSNGQHALDYCIKHPPAGVFTDIMMPLLDGKEFLRRLKANHGTALVPVMFVSAKAGVDALANGLETGADDYMVKPFSSREFLARAITMVQTGLMRSLLEKKVDERTRELQESERNYRDLSERYYGMTELVPIGIFTLASNLDLIYVNPQFTKITGFAASTPFHEDNRLLMKPESREAAINFEKKLADPSVREASAEMAYETGRVGLSMVRRVDGFEGFLGCIVDITETRRLEALQRETAEQRIRDAEEHKRQQEHFLDITSHELRNPLSAVWQNAECLAESMERMKDFLKLVKGVNETLVNEMKRRIEDDKKAINSILLCASHQARIANDILNVSKSSIGLLEINPMPMDLQVKIREVLSMFESDCRHKKITLIHSSGPGIETDQVVIKADGARIAQILINLLSNAVKHTDTAIKREIHIRLDMFNEQPAPAPDVLRVGVLEPMPGMVWFSISVQDSGKGLTEDDLKKVFKRFSQVNPKTDAADGAGLGLYISKQLVELHNGFIEVDSSPGNGSKFTIVFPSEKMQELTPKKTEKKNSRKRRYSSRQLHILVVEDNEINQQVLKRQLERNNMKVTVANNGQEGLDKILAGNFDVVLMDDTMPIMTGQEATRELRRLEQINNRRRQVVFVVTGNGRQAQIAQFKKAGFDHVFIKPYMISDIVDQIRERVD